MKRHNDIGAPLEPIFEHDHIDDFDELPCQYCNKNGKYASIPMQEYVSQTILAHQSNEGCWNFEDIDQEFRSTCASYPTMHPLTPNSMETNKILLLEVLPSQR